jgi:hypothetical protein
MKINLLKNEEGTGYIGYDIVPENDEDKKALGAVRDMIFFGYEDTAIKYDGIETSDDQDPKKRYLSIKRLKFRKQKYISK